MVLDLKKLSYQPGPGIRVQGWIVCLKCGRNIPVNIGRFSLCENHQFQLKEQILRTDPVLKKFIKKI
jgi:hypothetical protein